MSAAADPGRLRASHADREQLLDVLKVAFVEGRLTRDEFDARAAQALASRTYAELTIITADLPAAPPPRVPVLGPVQPAGPISLMTATTALTAGLWAAVLYMHPEHAALGALLFTVTFAWLGSLVLSGAVLLEQRRHKRSGGQFWLPG